MIFFNKKVKYTVLNKDWTVLFDNLAFKIEPRENELIFDGSIYYKVLNLVHDVDLKKNIIIVVEQFGLKT